MIEAPGVKVLRAWSLANAVSLPFLAIIQQATRAEAYSTANEDPFSERMCQTAMERFEENLVYIEDAIHHYRTGQPQKYQEEVDAT